MASGNEYDSTTPLEPDTQVEVIVPKLLKSTAKKSSISPGEWTELAAVVERYVKDQGIIILIFINNY